MTKNKTKSKQVKINFRCSATMKYKHIEIEDLNLSVVSTKYWHKLPTGKIQCDLCPRNCKLGEGQKGLCYVRERSNDEVVLTTYGRSSGFCIDPIEKKPLNHFLPGTAILSFGTAGCNLACKFCQNWDISKSREMDTLSSEASPEDIASTASKLGAKSIAFTYNDPVIFLEYAKDCAIAAKEKNLKSVAVTAGYINPKAREDFFSFIDAANVDLKAFTQSFYKKICGGDLSPILETLIYLKKETNVWFEITTLLIPGENDSEKEIEEETQWIIDNLGPNVPIHFTSFHPDYKMRDKKNTSLQTLKNARKIAKKNGINHVYTGNIHDEEGSSTYCPNCKNKVIGRDWFKLSNWELKVSGNCKYCETKIEGLFEDRPGEWGPKRLPVYNIKS